GEIYKCVVLANTHSDALADALGSVTTLAELKTVYKRVLRAGDMYNSMDASPDLFMNGTVNVTSATTSLTCALYRNVAKLTLTITNHALSGVTITSVQLRNVPDHLFYADQLFNGDATPSPSAAQSGVIDLPVDALELAPGALVKTLRYYLPRNRQGTTGASTEAGKNVGAPGRATYIEIMAVTAGAIEDGGGKPLRYRFYPGADMKNDFNIVPNYHYTLPVVFSSAGAEGDSRVENLGRVQLAEANSYIVNPLPGNVQATYGVPVTRVNKFWGSVDGAVANVLATDTEWEAEVIWQDGGTGIKLINFCESSGTVIPAGKYGGKGENHFYFSPAGSTASGNVLIGVKKKGTPASEGYLWSWHLWLTNYNPDNAPLSWQEDVYSYPVTGGAVHRYSGATWAASYTDKFIMDRNLGAASATRADGIAKTCGLYYQFGRKEPFPAAGVKLYNASGAMVTAFTATPGDCIVRVQGRTATKTAIQHPYNFYYPESGNGDWVQSNPYPATSWNNPTWQTSTTKSLFDPCPPGWRLPVNGTWATSFLSGTNTPNAANYPGDYKNGQDQAGWEFYMSGSSGETAFYPASGFRHVTTGTMYFERNYGYNWSSTPNSSTSYSLHFTAANVYPQYAAHRGLGLPARCIQE
ncbi:MAG: DUF4906 domain-containing protein, partial [Odoribacteraceae bacterium]|nr:DUF4906 domain-containing protein [Odoribacteraceae bacterium]